MQLSNRTALFITSVSWQMWHFYGFSPAFIEQAVVASITFEWFFFFMNLCNMFFHSTLYRKYVIKNVTFEWLLNLMNWSNVLFQFKLSKKKSWSHGFFPPWSDKYVFNCWLLWFSFCQIQNFLLFCLILMTILTLQLMLFKTWFPVKLSNVTNAKQGRCEEKCVTFSLHLPTHQELADFQSRRLAYFSFSFVFCRREVDLRDK